ncbi:MAG: site-2 protease family protein [Candidatus Brocadiaceae bacterium]|nr:site-2 protease family protein [Candidatus Brocadiaceae bacterium]
MNKTLVQGSWKIATIIGIPIRVHFSWFIAFGLITWSLSTQYFPKVAPELPVAAYWIKGTLAALLLFASVVIHELSHSYISQKYRIPIASITLFIFGGVAQLKEEPPHPKAEFWVAIAGPISSFLLSAIFFLVAINTAGGTGALFSYLARINFILGAFNLIPGFPMDGGRLLRAALWSKTKDFFRATQKAAAFGQAIALFFLFLGLLLVFTGSSGGFWLLLLGWFLYMAAQSSLQQANLHEILSGIKVKEAMTRDVVTLNSALTIEDVVDKYFLRYGYGYGGFPVMDDGKLLGIVTLKEIKDVPRKDWSTVKVSNILIPHNKKWEVTPDSDLMRALELMIKEDKGRIIVMEDGKVVGLITRNGIARYLRVKGK